MQNHCAKPVLKKAQDYLSRRAHSEYELQCKLLKHFDLPAVEKALSRVRELKWLDPPEELARRVAQQLHEKNQSWLFIRRALSKKRLPEVPKEEKREEEKCLWWLAKKFPRAGADGAVAKDWPNAQSKNQQGRREQNQQAGGEKIFAREEKSFGNRVKMSRFLSYRGFEPQTIKKAIDRFFRQT